jgi:hypothetical protein
MDLDDVTLELRTREHVSVPLTEFPLLESDLERAKAARRLIGHAGREIGAKIRTVHVRHLRAAYGYVDREPSQEELGELMELAFGPPRRSDTRAAVRRRPLRTSRRAPTDKTCTSGTSSSDSGTKRASMTEFPCRVCSVGAGEVLSPTGRRSNYAVESV